jgi:hypothetical protein
MEFGRTAERQNKAMVKKTKVFNAMVAGSFFPPSESVLSRGGPHIGWQHNANAENSAKSIPPG